jgi:hypothetical protein
VPAVTRQSRGSHAAAIRVTARSHAARVPAVTRQSRGSHPSHRLPSRIKSAGSHAAVTRQSRGSHAAAVTRQSLIARSHASAGSLKGIRVKLEQTDRTGLVQTLGLGSGSGAAPRPPP